MPNQALTFDWNTAQPISQQPQAVAPTTTTAPSAPSTSAVSAVPPNVSFDWSTAQPTQQQEQPPSDYLTKTEDFIDQAAKGVGSEVAGTVQAIPSLIEKSNPFAQAYGELGDIPSEYRAYEAARAQGKSPIEAAGVAAQTAYQKSAAINALKDRVKEFSANPARATGRAIADLLPMILGGPVTGEAEVEAAPAVASTEPAEAETAFSSPSKANIFQQVIQGKKVGQPAAQQAIRQGAQAAAENAGTADESVAANIANEPILNGNKTVLDEHLANLRSLEQDAYDKMDEAAGFDVKGEKAQLANDQYKLKQLGNTDADLALKENLQASINDSQVRITDAEKRMSDAGVDPTEADSLHKQRMAGIDFRKALIQNASADGSTVNVNGLLNAAKKLRFSKYGDRLTQFFGSSDAADDFMSNLQQAKQAGDSAVRTRQIAKWIAIGGGLYGAHHLLSGLPE